MDIDEAFRIVNAIFFTQQNKYLNDLDGELFKACWQGETFKDFAGRKNYTIDHIKTRAAQLWKLLSVGVGEPVNLRNLKQVLKRYQQTQIIALERSPQIDWGEAPDVSFFCGREADLSTLKDWVLNDCCRAIALLGMGGIGKTTLSVKLAQEIQSDFEFVIWRSLREAPGLETLLNDVIDVLSNYQEIEHSLTLDRKITQLISYLRNSRCLLVLDNVEAILQAGISAKPYREGYDHYGKLFQRLCESSHQSCIVFTSREKLREVAVLEGDTLPVRCWRVLGLQSAATQILTAKGVTGSDAEKQRLIQLYDGHPQALMLVSTSIRDLFAGQISHFLEQGTVTFNGIRRLLDEQFHRLSDLEQTILYWLAINREPVPIATLLDDIVPQTSQSRLLESLEELRGRCLVETNQTGYTLQNVVMEYLTSKLIDHMSEAITTEQIEFLHCYALIKATAKDYVKEAQIRLILQPVASSVSNIHQHLNSILAIAREHYSHTPSYAGGNIFNLSCHLSQDLSHADFSHLILWQADLQKQWLYQVNFAYSVFHKASFIQPFGFVQGVAFSPDGRLLATGTSNGDIRIWRVADFREIYVLREHTNWVWQIAFSADGQFLVSGSADCTVKLWQIGKTTGHCLQTLQEHTDEVYSVALSPDGQTVASGSRDHTVKLWQFHTGECLQTIREHTNVVCAVAFSPDGHLLASSGYDKTIKLWQMSNRQCLKTLEGHRGELSTVAFSPDGKLLASGGYECTVKLWQVDTGECIRTLVGHTSRISCVQFSPDNTLLVSCSHSQNIKLWQVSTGECLNNFQGHTNLIRCVTFSPDGMLLASGGDDQRVKIWQVATGDCLKTWHGYSNCVWNVTFSPDGKQLASANHDRTIRLWSVETGKCDQTLLEHEDCAWSVVFSPNGKLLASTSNELGEGALRLWQLGTGESVKLVGHLGSVHSIQFSPDGQWLASCGTDFVIKLWKVDTQHCLKTLQGHTGIIRSVCFSPDGQWLVSGSDDRTIKLWHVSTGECLKTLVCEEDWVWSVVFSPDGEQLASCGEDSTIKLWQVSTGECVRVLRGHWNAVYTIQFSPDGTMLASAGTDGSIRLWHVKTGACFQVIQAHREEIWSIAFSPDGEQLASGSEDGTIKLWQVATGLCLQTLKAPKPYEGTNITGVTGFNEAQKAALKSLGAVECEM